MTRRAAGTGHGTAWLLAGMDGASVLDTVDTDHAVVAVAERHLGADRRVRFHIMDGAAFLRDADSGPFDLIYADAWPGKFSHLDEALALGFDVATGGTQFLIPRSAGGPTRTASLLVVQNWKGR